MLSRRALFQALPAALAPAAPDVRFAVIADIQYADRDPAGRREYRRSREKLQAAADLLATEKPAFTIQLGDLIDGGEENLKRILPVFRRLPGPRYHVLGNHDFFGDRAAVLAAFGLRRAYYSFRVGRWRMVVLDGMQVTDAAYLKQLKDRKAINAYDWNGAVGEVQRRWLEQTLELARRRKEPAIVFCHFPTLDAACRPEHLLWDHAEVLSIVDWQPAMAAWFNGHDHAGGYAEHQGVHHVTVAGVVENDVTRCVHMVELGAGQMTLRGPGRNDGHVLTLRR